jgi:hypothetical protein
MEWYRHIQFIAAVPMPEDAAEDLGTTVNGMWAGPEARAEGSVARAHARGQRVLFSVPLIALVPAVYKANPTRNLLDEVCRDIQGKHALVPWYYWEPEPVYAACIYSRVFRRYLLGRCRDGIDRGIDVVNLDEINTSIGLMSRAAGAPGFCRYCLAGFRGHIRGKYAGPEPATAEQDAAVLEMDDDALRAVLRGDESLYLRYRRFHEREAFGVVESFITELRGYASHASPGFAVTANLACLGNEVVTRGDLWGPRWGQHLDFVMMENIYRPEPGGPHLLLPRGKFTAWYRLGSAISGQAPTWICPSILVPRQLAGQSRTQYYLLMFLEAYANGGRWGYYWWPGVDAATRMNATVPTRLKDYIRFISRYRRYYEQVPTANALAILYLDGCISRKPEAHYKYLALAQVMAEAGYQFDVLFYGDGEHDDRPLDLELLKRYKALLIPEAGSLGHRDSAALTTYVSSLGGKVAVFSEHPLGRTIARREGEQALFDFWTNYRPRDRQRILASVQPLGSAPVRCSDPLVSVICYGAGNGQVLHLLNYNYDASSDRVAVSRDLRIDLPWEPGTEATCTLLRPDGEQRLECALDNGGLTITVPDLDLYGLVVIAANDHQARRPESA